MWLLEGNTNAKFILKSYGYNLLNQIIDDIWPIKTKGPYMMVESSFNIRACEKEIKSKYIFQDIFFETTKILGFTNTYLKIKCY